MLRELMVQSFALIDELRLEFGPGFTVLTGETGAGKSIIIDALNAVLGERMGADAIRGGEATARVEAVFDAADAPRALAALDAAGLRDGADTTLILSREIAGGRSQYRVNRRASTLGALQEIGRHLVDIHGQHEHQALIHEENHLAFLDVFGGPEHLALRARYEAQFRAFDEARAALRAARMDERERAQRADMLRFQVDEIDRAELRADEEETLRAERLRLQHAERVREGIAAACGLLDGEPEGALAARAAVETAGREVAGLAKIDPELAAVAAEVDQAGVIIREAARTLTDYLERLQADPERLEAIERRMADIAALKRKYGDTLAEVLDFRERAAAELERFDNIETRREELLAELERRAKDAGDLAAELSVARRQLAERLRTVIEAELGGLGMPAAGFEAALEHREDVEGLPVPDGRRLRADARGVDICSFRFNANAGEALRPLNKVASGGELSRLMLAFKSVCSRGGEIPTIAFDEIDAGIGGRVAHAVGERLAAVAGRGQVLCVTHLPQIARLADAHIAVSKQTRGGRTVIRAAHLEDAARVDEIARMLGGAEDDATARQHARELLTDAAAHRATMRG